MPQLPLSGDATKSPSSLIAAIDLRKSYDKPNGESIEVLDCVSLEIRSRKVLAIVGPSGSGKSTLLRLLAGIEKPTEGKVAYHFGDGRRLPPVPMVLQSPALLPWRTVRENIALGMELAGMPRNVLEAEKYATLMGLKGFSDFLPKDISGGMRARVSIGRALIAASNVVLFDEAFTELDEVTRQILNDIFCQHVEQKSLAAVVISHDIAEAVYLADEVIVLSKLPARVARTFPVDLPRPRDPAIRFTQEYLDIVQPIREFARNLWR